MTIIFFLFSQETGFDIYSTRFHNPFRRSWSEFKNYGNTLQKQAYSNILKILPPKHEDFQIKKSDFFLISAQNIDCGYSLDLPQ